MIANNPKLKIALSTEAQVLNKKDENRKKGLNNYAEFIFVQMNLVVIK